MPLPEDDLEPGRGQEPAPAAELPSPNGFFYGGQAVIEGVMMRGRRHYAVAVRNPRTREIVLQRGELTAPIYTSAVWRLPFLRGLALLAEQMHLGMKSLVWSANVNAGAQDIAIGRREIFGSMLTAVAGSLLLFIGIPLLAARFAVAHSNSFTFVLVEGLVRVALVLGYLAAIAMVPDVRRVFQYHGAEHKTINAYEAGLGVGVPAVRRASLLHPRCGTGFLVVVLVVSVLVFSLVAAFQPSFPVVVASRLLGVPVIAGVSYEWIRLMARHRDNAAVKVMLIPVLGTQKFTTREPSDDQLEVAIAAFNAAREGEESLPVPGGARLAPA